MLINAYSTVVELESLDFPHELNARRDLTDPDLLEHLNGFVGYVISRGNNEMTFTKYHLICHIQRVRHQVSLSIEEKDLNALAGWAADNNSIIFLQDGTIRDPYGHVLVQSDGGEPDEEAQLPYPGDAVDRLVRTNEYLQQEGVCISKSLPPVIGQQETVPRDAQGVALRALGLFVTAVRAESIASEKEISVADLKSKRPVSPQAFTPAENAFLDDRCPDEQQVVNFVWRYESLNLLLWALQVFQVICDASPVGGTFPDGPGDTPRSMLP